MRRLQLRRVWRTCVGRITQDRANRGNTGELISSSRRPGGAGYDFWANNRSASSRLFDLNGEAHRLRKKQSSGIIAVDVRGFGHVINKDGVLRTHNRIFLYQ